MKTFYYIAVFSLVAFQIAFSQVGINTTNPKSTLDVNGTLSLKTVILTGSASATQINDGVYISIDPQATNQEFQLPSAIDFPGRIYFIRNIALATTAKLTASVGALFSKNSASAQTEIYMYEGNLKSIIVISDGTNWTYF